MLAIVPKPKTPKPASPEASLTQTAFRLPSDVLDGLDALVTQLNESRPWPKMTRSDLVRIILTKTLEDRPAWLVQPDLGGK